MIDEKEFIIFKKQFNILRYFVIIEFSIIIIVLIGIWWQIK